MRLNDMAHVRAQTIAARIKPNVRQPGQPRWSRAATAIAATANGRAKRVCENLTNSAHLRSVPNIRLSVAFNSANDQAAASAPGAATRPAIGRSGPLMTFTPVPPASAGRVFAARPGDRAHGPQPYRRPARWFGDGYRRTGWPG